MNKKLIHDHKSDQKKRKGIAVEATLKGGGGGQDDLSDRKEKTPIPN